VRATPLMIVLAVSLQPTFADEALKEYASEVGRFKVLLPGTPEVQKMTQKAPDGSDVEMTVFRCPKVGGNTVIIATSEFAESYLKNSTEEILDNARDGSIGRSKGKLVSEKKIKWGDHPGPEFVVGLPKERSFIRARAYMVGKRQFSILIVGNDEKAIATKEVEALVDSFKFAK